MKSGRSRYIKWTEDILRESGPLSYYDLTVKLREMEVKKPGGHTGHPARLPSRGQMSNILGKNPQFVNIGTKHESLWALVEND